jgi:hypothetical protein
MRGSLTFALIAASLLTTLVTPAHARFATYVAAYGADSGNCSYSAPCRTLTYALAQVDSGGVVTIIDSAGYENITIGKPVTIMAAPGALPSLRTTNTNGAVIVINFVSGTVTLIGLTLDGGTQAADTGIQFLFGPSVIIKNSIIKNFSASGIALVPNMASTIAISDTMVASNGAYGILLQPLAGNVYAMFNRVEAYKNGQAGIGVFGNLSNGVTSANAVDCVSAHNLFGYRVTGPTSGFDTLFELTRSTAFNNSTQGLFVENASQVEIGQSSMGGNFHGLSASSNGAIYSYGDNLTEGVPLPPGASAISKY